MARSWQASQHQCSQAGDHLLCTIPQSDNWTWGNICPDSPGKHPVNTLPANISFSAAPLHSMWTDSSENLQTNSELCEGRGPDWRGAPCQSFLYGVCQSQVSPAPSPPLTLPSPQQLSPDVRYFGFGVVVIMLDKEEGHHQQHHRPQHQPPLPCLPAVLLRFVHLVLSRPQHQLLLLNTRECEGELYGPEQGLGGVNQLPDWLGV